MYIKQKLQKWRNTDTNVKYSKVSVFIAALSGKPSPYFSKLILLSPSCADAMAIIYNSLNETSIKISYALKSNKKIQILSLKENLLAWKTYLSTIEFHSEFEEKHLKCIITLTEPYWTKIWVKYTLNMVRPSRTDIRNKKHTRFQARN